MAGWASFLRYRLWEATLADGATIDEHVIGLLAIRLAYDAGLAGLHPEIVAAPGSLYPAESEANDRPPPSEGVLGRYLFQVAAEVAYRRVLCGELASRSPVSPKPDQPHSRSPVSPKPDQTHSRSPVLSGNRMRRTPGARFLRNRISRTPGARFLRNRISKRPGIPLGSVRVNA